MKFELQRDEDGDTVLSVISADGKMLPLLWFDESDGSICLVQQNSNTEAVKEAGVALDLFNYPLVHRS